MASVKEKTSVCHSHITVCWCGIFDTVCSLVEFKGKLPYLFHAHDKLYYRLNLW